VSPITSMLRNWLLALIGLRAGFLLIAAAEPPKSQTADPEAMALVQDMLLKRPPNALNLTGVFKIRHSDGHKSEVPVSYAIELTATNWHSVYQTQATPTLGPERLVVAHQGDQPNQYLFTQVNVDHTRTNTVTLQGNEATLAFAGTDFWLSDLGMEFLHWPQQRLLQDPKLTTMRMGRPCKVLESTNPHPAAGHYARVISWIDVDFESLIRAEAYDINGKRYKVFFLKSFKKVAGHWQVQDMEINNQKTNSRTLLEFTFETR
jgi:hypothetical protein